MTSAQPEASIRNSIMKAKSAKIKINKTKLLVDIGAFVAFLIATAPRFSGIAIHEWLSIALAAALIVHLLLNWAWIVAITRRLFSKAIEHKQRINYILNALLFIDIVVIMVTGIVLSEVALPQLGIQITRSMAWRGIHGLASDAGVIILGLHLGLHWRWLVGTISTHLIKPVTRLFHRPARREEVLS